MYNNLSPHSTLCDESQQGYGAADTAGPPTLVSERLHAQYSVSALSRYATDTDTSVNVLLLLIGVAVSPALLFSSR